VNWTRKANQGRDENRRIMIKSDDNANWKDNCIREVRINYLLSDQPRTKVSGPNDIAEFVRTVMVDNSREQFIAMYFDAAHCIAAYSIITIGTANQSLIHPREVFQRAILVGATAFAVAHNHPSGSTSPSKEDINVTKRLREAGLLLGIEMLDHVIVTDKTHVSFREDVLHWGERQ